MTDYAHSAFHLPALIWPIALIVFVTWFFRKYRESMRPGGYARRRSRRSPPRAVSLSFDEAGQSGAMTKRDWCLASAVTLIYGALAFAFVGYTEAPQTFWRSTDEQLSFTLDLGEDVLLDNVLYYAGLGEDMYSEDIFWTLEFSSDGLSWRRQLFMSHADFEVFTWRIPMLEPPERPIRTRYLRLTADTGGMELRELVLFVRDEDGRRTALDMAGVSQRHPEYAALFDEQSMAPELPDMGNNELFDHIMAVGPGVGRISTHRSGTVFDEVFHARTAYEHTRGYEPTEISHPPLGKLLISLGISLFGMTPFGWRFMGVLFGILMVPLIYAFIKKLFGNTKVAVCGAVLFAFENMHFTQTRVATLDSFLVFFVLAMYFFMYCYITSGYGAAFKKTLPPLFLCGLCFGLGAAVKWQAAYAALGLVLLYVLYLVKRGKSQAAAGQNAEFRLFLYKTLAASVALFVVVPFAIYTLSYIPYATANGQPLTAGGLFSAMWGNQGHMLAYHTTALRDVEHPNQSPWWMWLFGVRPIYYYFTIEDHGRTVLSAFTNPLVTIGGLVAVFVSVSDFIRKRSMAPFVIAVGYFAQLLPWIPVPRGTFVYHYFPSMVFLTLAICYVFNNLLKRDPEARKQMYLFTGASVAIFLMLYPSSAGIPIPNWYSDWFTRWLPTWRF